MYVDDAGLEALFICVRKGYNMAEKGFADLLEREVRITEKDMGDMYNLWQSGMKQKDIGTIYNLGYSVISRYIKEYADRHNIPKEKQIKALTKGKINFILKSLKVGGTMAEVAKKLGMSPTHMRNQLVELGIDYKKYMEGIV